MKLAMSATLLEGIKVQKRVVWALMLRETKTLFGKHKLGYLWAIINAAYQIGIFWGIREVGGFHPPHGMSTPAFLLGGFIPFYLFSNTVSGAISAINGNRALLVYPQVFPLDIIVARTLLQGAMQIFVFFLLILLAMVLGKDVQIVNIGALLCAFAAAVTLGFAVGTLSSGLNVIWPVTEQIVPMITRVLFFTSGLFFTIVDLPSRAKAMMYYNPLCHIIVMARSSFVNGYGTKFIFIPYLLGFIVLMLALGLLLERYSRLYLDRVV